MQSPLRGEVDEATSGSQDPALVVLHGHDGAYGARYLIGVHQTEVTITVDPTPVHSTGQNVHRE
jgi:hypothetical protein